MNTHKAIGIVVAILLAVFGVAFPLPEKHLYVSSYAYQNNWMEDGEEYVGGDAYNYQMEASLKAGWVSGVLALKAICVASGILLFFGTLYSNNKDKELMKQTSLLEQLLETKSNLPQEQDSVAKIEEISETENV